jgi:hypothetical protein
MLNTVQHEIGREHISETRSCKCLMTAVEAPMRPAHGLNAGLAPWFRQTTQLTIKPRTHKAMSMIT